MKRSNLAIFLAAAVLMFSLSALAQDPQGPGEGGRGDRGGRRMPSVEDQTKDLATTLKLSDDQTKQVRVILQDQQDQRQKLMQDQSLSFEEKMPKMRELHETASGKIRALLTDDQKKQYDEMEKERQERRQHRKGQQPSGDATPPQ